MAEVIKEELYQNVRKKYPGQLPFPERFDIKLDKTSFDLGGMRPENWDEAKELGLIWSDPKVVEDNAAWNNRLSVLFRRNLPKSFISPEHEMITDCSAALYNDIQFTYSNPNIKDEWDTVLEYYFRFYPLNDETRSLLISYDKNPVWDAEVHEKTIRARIQYAPRYVNTAGAYYELYGYLYIPTKRKQ